MFYNFDAKFAEYLHVLCTHQFIDCWDWPVTKYRNPGEIYWTTLNTVLEHSACNMGSKLFEYMATEQ